MQSPICSVQPWGLNGFVLAYSSLTGVLIKTQDVITLRNESALVSLFQKELTSQQMNEKGKSSDGTFLSQIWWRIKGNSSSKGVSEQESHKQSLHTQSINFPSVSSLYQQKFAGIADSWLREWHKCRRHHAYISTPMELFEGDYWWQPVQLEECRGCSHKVLAASCNSWYTELHLSQRQWSSTPADISSTKITNVLQMIKHSTSLWLQAHE